MSFKSEIWWKLYGEDRDCTFNAVFYHHLLNLDLNFKEDVFDIKKDQDKLLGKREEASEI